MTFETGASVLEAGCHGHAQRRQLFTWLVRKASLPTDTSPAYPALRAEA
jgi:hypothetical protein